MTNLLILTVGTGTAGRHSDLASGLRRTLELLNPRKFWLVPSTAPDSLAIADLIAEGHASYGGRFPLEHPDDLESSRQHIRSVIRRVRGQVKEGERLLVNPTSGTKQMTAAATSLIGMVAKYGSLSPPWAVIMPLIDCNTGSKAGFGASAPCSPKPAMDSVMMPGWTPASVA